MKLRTKLQLHDLTQGILDIQNDICRIAVNKDVPREVYKRICLIDKQMHEFRRDIYEIIK